MSRSGNSNATSGAASTANLKSPSQLHWSLSYEFDWPGATTKAPSKAGANCCQLALDELSARLDKALAYAG